MICFSHFTLFKVECEELFWKLILNYKVLKLQIMQIKKNNFILH